MYETCVDSLRVLLCVRVREFNLFLEESWRSYDFLVIDGSHPPIRTWSDYYGGAATMEKTMTNFRFKRIG